MLTIIEGMHLRRGAVAAACSLHAVHAGTFIGLSWGRPALADARLFPRVEPTTARYYDAFEALLEANENALVVPSTQRGMVLASRFDQRHRVLAEPGLSGLDAFDKLRLRALQPGLTSLLVPCFPIGHPALSLPALAKPRAGHSSEGHVLLIASNDGSELAATHFAEPLLPDGRQEYSLTIVASEGGRRWSCIRRVRQAGGRTVAACRTLPAGPAAFARQVAHDAHVGTILNVQFAWFGESGAIYDLNPRFGYGELFRACFGFNFVAEWLGAPSEALSAATELDEAEAWARITAVPGQDANAS